MDCRQLRRQGYFWGMTTPQRLSRGASEFKRDSGGRGGIRTHGRRLNLQRFSKPPH
jgi:hypothetical protein